MLRWITLAMVLTAAMAVSVLGQITIQTNGFLPSPGSMIDYQNDNFMNQTFFDNLTAASGGPMTWDFSSRTYGTGYTVYSVALPSTPAIDSFPKADLSLLTVNGSDSSWEVCNSTSSLFERVGSISHVMSDQFVEKYFDIAPGWTFPLNYNDQWTAYRHWKDTSDADYSEAFDTTYNTVDAWGTAKYGSKSVPCLRVVSDERLTVNTYNTSGVLLGGNTTQVTTVSFVTTNFTTLVTATKVTSPLGNSYNGTASGDFVAMPTAVHERNDGLRPDQFDLSQNYPNPFNPTTEIRFSTPQAAHVSLAVYNVVGQKVKEILDGDMPAGSYAVDWDGTNSDGEPVASGIYFYRMNADKFSETKEMLLLK